MKDKNKYFTTSNLALASAIHAVSLSKLELIEFPPHGKRATFYFDRTKDPQFDEFLAQYWSRKLYVDAQSFFESIASIKSRMYEQRNFQSK